MRTETDRTTWMVVLLSCWLAMPASSHGGGPRPGAPDATYWIVLQNGQRLAARGGLEIRPGTVWFRDLDGRLLSMRLDLVDLEATRHAREVRTLPSPATTRNVEISEPHSLYGPAAGPPPPNPIGLAGESAKRAGQVGSFTDLSGVATARPEAGQEGKRTRRPRKRAAAPGEPTAGAGPPPPRPARP